MTTIRNDGHVILEGAREDGTHFEVDLTALYKVASEALDDAAEGDGLGQMVNTLEDGLIEIADTLGTIVNGG